MSKEPSSFVPQKGERAILIGQTGSGKTGLALFLLVRVPETPVLIYDTKDEGKFLKLPNNKVCTTMEAALEEKDNPEIDYLIIRPEIELLNKPAELDRMLLFHYQHFHNCPAYIDEAYTFHSNGREGPGLVALYTRGRSRGITTILSTQRPVRISRFCISEAQKAYVLKLGDKRDRKTLNDVIPNFDEYPLPPKHGFYYYESGEDAPELYRPIKLDPAFDTGYTDETGPEDLGDNNPNTNIEDNPGTKHIWI